MCGIVGIASLRPARLQGWLAAGNDALTHRGPDDSGSWWSADGCVGMAHRRLAIIDLSPGGRQPMHDAAGELCIVFNGELYNFLDLKADLQQQGFVFRSRSDTEVVLAAYRAWGEDCLQRFKGMFAFALYDARRRTLFLARDRAGEKPIFYYEHGGSIRFSSELKALLADPSVPRNLDATALDCYLAMGFVPGERCMLAGIRKLPPAHALVFELASGRSRVWRYWQLPEPPAPAAKADAAALVEELETLLEGAVRRQLVSDVPLGILLSGGMDSSLVTAMAARAVPRIRTFTIRFPGHGKYDETEHARLIARHFATDHQELEAAPTTVDLLPRLARQFDNPIVDSSMVPTYLVSRLIREHCTVALGGDGGDELFGGYSHYDRLLKMQRLVGSIPRGLRRSTAALMGAVLPIGFKGRNWLQAMGADLRKGVPLLACYFDAAARKALLKRQHNPPERAEDVWHAAVPRAGDLLERATRADFNTYLAEDILVKVDRASMLNSLEVRAPMLDVDMLQFAFAKVPSRLKATSRARKILLSQLAAKVLPAAFKPERKQGFSIPLDSWLRSGPWLDYTQDVLFEGEQRLFDHAMVRRLLAGQRRGRSNGERLFALVMLELWRREYAVQA